jgi:ubiquitin carboxyl-terminal hydrolase 8
MSVAEIKEHAKQQAQRASRGASAISLIRSAKGQISLAQSREGAGDLKGALSAFTKAASLTQVFMDSAEFKAENVPGKRGLVWKEFSDFQQVWHLLDTPFLSS